MPIPGKCLVARRLAAVSFLVLAAVAGAPPAHAAAPTELFFSEYVEGSSNNKALEIYNGTGAAIDLATGGYNVQMFFNGSATAGLTINLTGTVAAGDVYVLAQSAANAAILAQADQTNGSGWFNGDDAVVLRKGTTVVDVDRPDRLRPRHRVGLGARQHRGQHAAPQGHGVRRRPERLGRLRPRPGVGRLRHRHVRRARGARRHLRHRRSTRAGGDLDVPGRRRHGRAPRREPDRHLQRARERDRRVVHARLQRLRDADRQRQRRPDHLHARPHDRLRPGRGVHAHDRRGQRHRPGRERPAGLDDGGLRRRFLDRRRLHAALHADPGDPGQRPDGGDHGPGHDPRRRGRATTRAPSPALRGFYLQDAAGDGDPATSDGIFVFNGNNNSVSARRRGRA